MAQSNGRRTALQAARAAGLAVHAASGLALGTSVEASRLLRVAEGLCRAASALLSAEGTAAAAAGASGAGGTLPAAGPAAGRRKKKPRKKKQPQSREEDSDQVMTACEAGGSVVIGDLTEFGLPDLSTLVLPPPGKEALSTTLALESAGDGGAAAGGQGAAAAAPPQAAAVAPTSVATAPTLAEARSTVEALQTQQLRSLAQALGGSGQGSRGRLIAFCVQRRIGGPERRSEGSAIGRGVQE